MKRLSFFLVFLVFIGTGLAQTNKQKKEPAPFKWVNPLSEKRLSDLEVPKTLQHATFVSPSMDSDVGYFIYLPPGYHDSVETRYPVVYYLHGGRPGGEGKSISLSRFVDRAIKDDKIEPTIYVYPNGGPVSWYDMPDQEDAMGESVFVKELIPHIDATYRTVAERGGRGIEGFSQGGRGTTRIMFKHPDLFGSAAPGGSGYEPEQRIKENDGYESETLRFLPIGYNTWDLAARFAESNSEQTFPIMLWVGTEGFNFEFNKKYSAYLKKLGIQNEIIIVEGVPHSATQIYRLRGLELMQFHQRNFGLVK